MFVLTNTLTGHEEIVTPHRPDLFTLYVCGITPYDYAHCGHGRCYVTFDVLFRTLKALYPAVSYVRNFTDIDDKLLQKAEEIYHDRAQYEKIAQQYIAAYHDDMQRLNCLPPTHEPRVTQYIPQIISFIEKLIATGHAYVVEGDVYFHVPSFA